MTNNKRSVWDISRDIVNAYISKSFSEIGLESRIAKSLEEERQETERLREVCEECIFLSDIPIRYLMCGEHKIADPEKNCHTCKAILAVHKIKSKLEEALSHWREVNK